MGYALNRSSLIDLLSFLLLIAFLTWLIFKGSASMGYRWQWYRVPGYLISFEDGKRVLGPLLQGLMTTFRITAFSLILTLIFGLLSALMRLSDSFVARIVARGYIELIRNTPLLVQIFFIYFVIAPVLGIGRFTSAVLALSLFEGAYVSEIFRAGIVSIHKGQWEAAYSLGLGTFHAYRHVVLPQAIRRVLPPLTSQVISLIKDSALVSTIAIYELTMAGQAIVSDTFLTFEIWFTIAAIYLVITISLSFLVNVMETRIKVTR
ncbi:MAG: amino acid ABC transporter permease [Deltaproteobacteria bacterium]|nr:amino acid ABC transporter permease [Deltaproteobacteria bacterium]MBW2323236.1 amino acid ABC transporter permease [Deltaproteobacteria bacterium]